MTRAAIVVAVSIAATGGLTGCRKSPDGVVILPGARPVSREFAERIKEAGRSAAGERLHTRHLKDGAPTYTNRLALEPSPYLQQHAHNPVDWRPWGEQAFAEARRLGRPILVSVGYSTCHWCHVMAEESFEDVDIATYMNRHYIAIKVDREERPDVDATYLKALEVMGVPGGWPMNVWLTPDGEPFFGATYLPPRDGDRGAKSGFLTVLRRGRELVDKDREGLARETARVAAGIRELTKPAPAAAGGLGPAALRQAVKTFEAVFDGENGGVALPGARNKFPADLPVRLLLRYARRTGDGGARRMAEVTLERMAAGGIRDHIGGGFHRYSTDPRWRVPHFEKMLYDNALLAVAYLEGYQATGREDFADVAREIFDFVEREMRVDAEAGYAAALDADSAGADGTIAEGLYYTWTPAEVDAALNAGESARLVRAYYGISQSGNFQGRSVLAVTRPLGEVAAALGIDEGRAGKLLADARPRLLAARSLLPRPHRDHKVIAGWNGLMASALVRAALVLERDVEYGENGWSGKYLRSATWIAESLVGTFEPSADTSSLPRIRRESAEIELLEDYPELPKYRGPVSVPGTLEDYAFAIAALLDVCELTTPRFCDEAVRLDRILARDFEDPAGGFYATPAGGDPRLLREKPFEDGALPSGNSVMALNLLRLATLTGKDAYRARADRLFAAASGTIGAEPAASSDLLLALDWRTDVPFEIILVAPAARSELAPFLDVLARTFVPNRVVIPRAELDLPVPNPLPLVAGKRAIGGKATAYVCLKGACKLPARDPETFAKQIAAAQPLP